MLKSLVLIRSRCLFLAWHLIHARIHSTDSHHVRQCYHTCSFCLAPTVAVRYRTCTKTRIHNCCQTASPPLSTSILVHGIMASNCRKQAHVLPCMAGVQVSCALTCQRRGLKRGYLGPP
ncbi:hypothetical protein ACQKWADRAFT_289984 [Trichoderma austrokoningii]